MKKFKPNYSFADLWKQFVLFTKNWRRKPTGELVNKDTLELTGDVKCFENIVDKDGHKRFIEGDITLRSEVPSGFKKTYGKWSLSGTHLLIVLAGEVDNGTEFSAQTICEMNNIPSWIPEKVQLLRPSERVVDQYNLVLYGGTAQSISVYLEKSSTNVLLLYLSTFTANADKTFRINFDLLIDNAERE